MSTFSSNEPNDPDQFHHAPALERSYLRRGVAQMAAERSQCTHCRRSPLVGERMRVFENEGADRVLCDICVSQIPAGKLGQPIHTHRVGAGERRLTVVRAA